MGGCGLGCNLGEIIEETRRMWICSEIVDLSSWIVDICITQRETYWMLMIMLTMRRRDLSCVYM